MTKPTDKETKPKDREVPSSKYGTRKFGRMGKTDGRNVKRLWKSLIAAGVIFLRW